MNMQRTVVRLGQFIPAYIISQCQMKVLRRHEVGWHLTWSWNWGSKVITWGYERQTVQPKRQSYKNYSWSFEKETLIYFHGHTKWRRKNKFIALSKSLFYAFPKSDFKEFESKLSLFIQRRCSQFPTFVFWMSSLNITDLFFKFVRATPIGDWALHLQSATKMVTWYFS